MLVIRKGLAPLIVNSIRLFAGLDLAEHDRLQPLRLEFHRERNPNPRQAAWLVLSQTSVYHFPAGVSLLKWR